MDAQLALFEMAADPVVIQGSVRLTWTQDGRTLLWVENTRGGGWLELRPDDQAWLAQHVVNPQGV